MGLVVHTTVMLGRCTHGLVDGMTLLVRVLKNGGLSGQEERLFHLRKYPLP